MKTIKQKSNKKVVLGILSAIILLFVTYSYATASTIISASDNKTKNQKIAELQTEISELEYKYFSMLDELPTDVEQYGLKNINRIGYASIESDVKVAYNY